MNRSIRVSPAQSRIHSIKSLAQTIHYGTSLLRGILHRFRMLQSLLSEKANGSYSDHSNEHDRREEESNRSADEE
jgi:hypothetical protein